MIFLMNFAQNCDLRGAPAKNTLENLLVEEETHYPKRYHSNFIHLILASRIAVR